MSRSRPGIIEAEVRPKGELWVGRVWAMWEGAAGTFATEREAHRFVKEFLIEYGQEKR